MSFLGLDIGTSGCKASVFDQAGRLLAKASREYSVRAPQPGWAELDSQIVGDLCLEVIREVAMLVQDDPVQALAISSQGEAFTALDAEGRVLADAMVSSDNRAVSLIGPWVEKFGGDRLYAKSGHTAHPIFTIFKLIWLQRHRPDIWENAARFFCFEDYIQLRLGVDPAISWSLAGRTLLFNVVGQKWDEEILEEVGLDAGQLARPLPPGAVVGEIPEGVTRALGLATGAIVVAGGHDQACAALGSGAVSPGQAALTTGSVECVTVTFQEIVQNDSLRLANLCSYSHALPGRHATLAYNLTGGNLLKWFRDELANTEREECACDGGDVYERIFQILPQRPSPLMVLPYFTGSGTPHFDALTPGAILGLRLDTTRGDILKGLLEGLANELRINLDLLKDAGIPVHEIFAVGGGAKNRAWLQLKADVLNQPILVPQVTETGCLGGALLSCSAVTGRPAVELVAEWIRIGDTVLPDPERAAYYQERLTAYRLTYESLRELSRQIF